MFQITFHRILLVLVGAIALVGCQTTGQKNFNPKIVYVPKGYEDHPQFSLQSNVTTLPTSGQRQKLIFNGGYIYFFQGRTGDFTRWTYLSYTEVMISSYIAEHFPNAYSINPIQKHRLNLGTVLYTTFFYKLNGMDYSCFHMGGHNNFTLDFPSIKDLNDDIISALFCAYGKRSDMADYTIAFLNDISISRETSPKN